MRAPKYSIILAAGKGTRMQSANLHKVCFPIDGIAAINRSLETYNDCGISYHIIVVGAMAQQVMDTVAAENVIYAYQAEQLGTAHAARQGAKVLRALDDQAEVLIVAGDRLIEPQVLEQFFDLFYSQECDLTYHLLRCLQIGDVLGELGGERNVDLWEIGIQVGLYLLRLLRIAEFDAVHRNLVRPAGKSLGIA